LSGAHVAGAFAGMVDEDDGDGIAPLQVPQIGEQWRHLAADVLVDLVEADEGVENEQTRFQPGDGLLETGAVGIEVEAQAGSGDDLDIEIDKIEAGGGADAVEPAPHDMQGVLGSVEQDASGPLHGEAAQAGCAGGDGDGKVEGEEGFAAFWLAAAMKLRLFAWAPLLDTTNAYHGLLLPILLFCVEPRWGSRAGYV
jgi:hypothetical protein